MMRYLHTMIRVVDLEKSLRFYTEGLGFRVVSKQDYPKDRFTLIFLESESEAKEPGVAAPQIELTHNWDAGSYERGTAYGHMAFAADPIAKDGSVSNELALGVVPHQMTLLPV